MAISEFKAKCIELLKLASKNEQELLITLRGKPLAKVSGIPQRRQRQLGGQRDTMAVDASDTRLIASDFESDWES